MKSLDESKACVLLRDCECFRMDRLARVGSGCRKLTNNLQLRLLELAYLMSLHSGYVNMKQENWGLIQPYSPHLFSRQFGFVQHVPGKIKGDIRTGSLQSVYLY